MIYGPIRKSYFFFEVKTKRGLLKTLKIIKSIYEQENTNPDNGGTVMQPS